MHSLLQLFSVPLRQTLATLPNEVLQEIQEIRVREQRPLEIVWGDRYSFVSPTIGICDNPAQAYIPTREDGAALLENLTMHSLYTFEEELRRGYITVQGGHRVGLAGRTVLEQGKVKLLKEIGSFNIRVARERRGAGSKVLPYLTDEAEGSVHHTLIISPPQQGKTTLIRDLARLISTGPADPGAKWLKRGYKVGIVDERSEVAACVRGIPRFELGPRTDVLDACPKAEGMMMMIRSMSPEILIVDEIGRPEDAAAIREALHAGIRVIATAHGGRLEDVRRRPVLKEMMEEQVFSRVVMLNRRFGVGTLEGVYDAHGVKLNRNDGSASISTTGTSLMRAAEPIDWTGNIAFGRHGEIGRAKGDAGSC